MTLFVGLSEPCEWVRADDRGRIVDRGESPDLVSAPRAHADEPVVAVVPGAEVVIHTVRVPARRRAALLAALPYSLEEWLSDEPDSLHFALLAWTPSTEEAVVAVVARARMDAWLANLAQAGLRARILLPDTLLAPIHGQTRATVLRRNEGEYVVRGPGLAAGVLDRATVPHWWQELGDAAFPLATNDREIARTLVEAGATHVSHWEAGTAWPEWVGQISALPAANLLCGDYSMAQGSVAITRLWPAAAIAAAAAVLAIGVDLYDYARLKVEARTLETRIAELYQRTFPGARPPAAGRVRQQFAQRLKLTGGDAQHGDFTVLLGAVSRILPPGGARVEELSFRDNRLTVACTSADFAGIERIKQALEREAGLQVELLSSGAREQQVTARFRLMRVPA